jgi:hypothetical protein
LELGKGGLSFGSHPAVDLTAVKAKVSQSLLDPCGFLNRIKMTQLKGVLLAAMIQD